MRWLLRIAERRHALVIPAVWLLLSLGYFTVVVGSSSGQSRVWESPAEIWGAVLVYCIVPAYLLFCAPFQWRRSSAAAADIGLLVGDPAGARVEILEPGFRVIATGTLLGMLYGLSQFLQTLPMLRGSGNPWLDFSMMGANVLLWTVGGWVLAWRLYAGRGLRRLGSVTRVDLYDLETLRPFARVAMLDVLVVMGTMALMPLQSLDAEFRWSNYEAGLLVTVPAAVVFFVLPLWGVHRRMVETRAERLAELQAQINGCARDDIARLDTLVAHRDRIRGIRTWPLDMSVVFRALFYLVIPPLAWVGAALVENLVERIIS